MVRKKEDDFMIVPIGTTKSRGILRTIGEREIVANMTMLDGADESDNEWAMQELMNLYVRYYGRVADHNRKREKI